MISNEELSKIASSLGLSFESFEAGKIKFLKKTGGAIMIFVGDSVSTYGVDFGFENLNFSIWCAAQWAAHCR